METELEYILANTYKAQMIDYMGSHPEAFEEAVQLALLDKQPYSKRAAWLLWSVMEDNDLRIQKYLNKIVDVLPNKHESQKRDLMAILSRMELNEDADGKLFDICVDVWKKIDKIQSVRYGALELIVKIARKYPDLLNEVHILVQDQYMEGLAEHLKKSFLKRFEKLKAGGNP